VMLYGAPGEFDKPLTKCTEKELAYVSVYPEEGAEILETELDKFSPRFGKPLFYSLKVTPSTQTKSTQQQQTIPRVHYTRLLHFTDSGSVYSQPRLERVWNLLDDLEKVTGGGSEAFFRRADQGLHLDMDPDIEFAPGEEEKIDEQVKDYVHGFRRVLQTRGVDVTPLGSDVAAIKPSADAIIDQISGATSIPQRVLMGSEQGKLASEQDSTKFDELMAARRTRVAGPKIVRKFVSDMIQLGVLPKPKQYYINWSPLRTRSDEEKAKIAGQWAALNASAGEVVVTADEIREHCLGRPALATLGKIKSVPLPGKPVGGPPAIPAVYAMEGRPTAVVGRFRYGRGGSGDPADGGRQVRTGLPEAGQEGVPAREGAAQS
jgi:hypothetical protein